LEEPRAYFTAFGNETLRFRLMVWLDIRERLQVVSDLHFAIDAAFREQGIQTRRG
jgi:small-conductance mechanosensitive channel